MLYLQRVRRRRLGGGLSLRAAIGGPVQALSSRTLLRWVLAWGRPLVVVGVES